VSAYPSLLVLGRQAENVYRFSGFKLPPDFLPELDQGLQRYALYLKGEAWDSEPSRPGHIVDQGFVRAIPAPSSEVPSGLCFLGERLFVAQKDTLAELDSKDGKVLRRGTLPESVRGLCGDGQQLFAVEYGWTAGKPIYAIDAATLQVTREIVTAANKEKRGYSAAAIEYREGLLWVLASGGLHAVDPATGDVRQVLPLQLKQPSALAFDGAQFVIGSREGLHVVDPATGNTLRSVATHYPVRAVACRGGQLFVMEQPIWGFDRQHQRIRVWPKQDLIHVLELPPAK